MVLYMACSGMGTGPPGNERIIVHIDYDCFYASVVENERPGLRSHPLGIQQKSILATCNYVARAQGVKKLQLVSEAKKACPDLVIVNGEDLSRFRDASKKLWLYVREFIWNYKVERLGLDEVFMDVTEMIDFNIANCDLADFPASVAPASLVPHTIADDDNKSVSEEDRGIGFFRLSPTDPEQGFNFSWRELPGHTYPPNQYLGLCASDQHEDDEWCDGEAVYAKHVRHQLHRRLFLAAHLADFLRKKVNETYNYTSSAGIATTKLTAKLVGSVHKPNKQTLLLPIATQRFLDGHEIGKIPGIGYKSAHLLRQELLGVQQGGDSDENSNIVEIAFTDKPAHPVTVYDARLKLHVDRLSKLLNSKEQAIKVHGWLHGVDNAAVIQASLVPTQISIEDTFRSLKGAKQVEQILVQLVTKLITRMRIDLLAPLPPEPPGTIKTPTSTPTSKQTASSQKKWLAYPRTFRLSLRSKDMSGPFFARTSKSAPLPRYVFSWDTCIEVLAEKLVREIGIPLLRRMGKASNDCELQLVNVAVVNMEEAKSGGGGMAGVDIGRMFTGSISSSGSDMKGASHSQFEIGDVESKTTEDDDWEKGVLEIEEVYRMLEEAKANSVGLAREGISHIVTEAGVGNVIDTPKRRGSARSNELEPRINVWTKDADDDNEIWDMDLDGDGDGDGYVGDDQTNTGIKSSPGISQSLGRNVKAGRKSSGGDTLEYGYAVKKEEEEIVDELDAQEDVEEESDEIILPPGSVNLEGEGRVCPKCGMQILAFAWEAHERFHEMGGD